MAGLDLMVLITKEGAFLQEPGEKEPIWALFRLQIHLGWRRTQLQIEIPLVHRVFPNTKKRDCSRPISLSD